MLAIKQLVYPEGLEQALTRLSNDRNLRICAGGTDLLPAIRDGRLTGQSLLMLSPLREELSGVTREADSLVIGALTLHEQIKESPLIRELIPPLATACGLVGSTQIRNRASLGGNILNASPAADSVPILLAAGAEAELRSAQAVRRIPLDQVALGPGRNCLEPDELLIAIHIPIPAGGWHGGYFKAGNRNALTISIAGAATLYNPAIGWRVALGSVGPKISRAPLLEAAFNGGGNLTRQELGQLLRQEARPIDDVRASAEYRLRVLTNALFTAYEQRRQVR